MFYLVVFLYHSLKSEESKKTLIGILKAGISDDNREYEKIYKANQYFAIPQFSYRRVDDILVDCGAYVGDTIERYLFNRFGAFHKIYAFEPGKKQMEAMQYRMERLKREWALADDQIVLVPYAVGEKSEQLKINIMNNLSSCNFLLEPSTEESMEVSSISLDEFFETKMEKPTFIKVDVEGFELELLKGAKNLIEKEKPLLALSVYHKAEDLWEIFEYVKGLREDYRFDLLHHSAYGVETILYCY